MELRRNGSISTGDEGDNPEECDVCSSSFDSKNHRPRCLPCCHTFCTQCIARIVTSGYISCPKCRERHHASSAKQFPVNFSLEALMQKLQAQTLGYHNENRILLKDDKTSSDGERLHDLIRKHKEHVQNLSSVYCNMGNRLADCRRWTRVQIDAHKVEIKHIQLQIHAPRQKFRIPVIQQTHKKSIQRQQAFQIPAMQQQQECHIPAMQQQQECHIPAMQQQQEFQIPDMQQQQEFKIPSMQQRPQEFQIPAMQQQQQQQQQQEFQIPAMQQQPQEFQIPAIQQQQQQEFQMSSMLRQKEFQFPSTEGQQELQTPVIQQKLEFQNLATLRQDLQSLDLEKHQEKKEFQSSATELKEFQHLAEENEAVLVLLEERLEYLTSLRQEGIEKCLALTASVLGLTAVPTHEEKMNQALAECEQCICIQDAWLEKCKVTLSDDRPAKASQKVLARTRDTLSMMSLTGDIERPSHSSSITVEVLLAMGEEVKSLLRNGQVFARHHMEGQGGGVGGGGPRFARVSLQGLHHLCLHHLQEIDVPVDAIILPYNEIYNLVDKTASLTFLDFGSEGLEHGRVHIRLQPARTGRAKQFALLCTGLLGHTYANTRLLAVGNRGAPSEFVRGGDYQYNNGTGGASLLPGLRRGGEYWKQQTLGSVMAAGSWGDACSAQFIISTRNPRLAQRDDTIFGQVEEGLQVLKAAIKDVRITKVNVTDCGIVIPL